MHAVVAPRHAFTTISEFLGDVQTHALGIPTGLGPMLAAEYVRRATLTSVRRLPAPDVVVAASHFTPDAVALAKLARRGAFGVAYVYHLIEDRKGLSPRTLWSKVDERLGLTLLHRAANLVFVSNTAVSDALERRGFEPVRTAVGIDLSLFEPVTPAALPPRAAFISRLSRSKGVTDAVEAWSLVRQQVPDATLCVVGAGPERGTAEALATRLGISEAVDWRGFVSEDEKRSILRESRLFIAPSYEEGWGISVCEALASGIPVVAYQLPVLDELFGRAYLGAPPGDVRALAELAIKVLSNSTLATKLSDEGREAAAQYDVDRVADQELEAILSACAS